MAGQKLIKQGYVQEREEYGVQRQITDAGREIVQRAREMGW
jgi:Mn-dependent DtxR family transcriptional regulator